MAGIWLKATAVPWTSPLLELGPDNLIGYLHETGRLTAAEADASRCEVLSGGVSNVVMRVSRPGGADFVIKQSRTQLRTQADWFSQPERIWRERDVLVTLSHVTPADFVPKVLFEDRDNFLFAMEAISREHTVWKTELLSGRADHDVARRLGEALTAIHIGTANDAHLLQQFGDRTIFDELRLDPFYRFVARREPELRSALERLIAETLGASVCLVLGDFSPKNILLVDHVDLPDRQIVLVDFETGHFGDPAFDLGFFLSHLFLKTIKHAARADEFCRLIVAFWSAYQSSSGQAVDLLEQRAVRHLAACMKARIDGKSTVDYLTNEAQVIVRETTRDWLLSPPKTIADTVATWRRRLKSACAC